jgi:hypothetical protein
MYMLGDTFIHTETFRGNYELLSQRRGSQPFGARSIPGILIFWGTLKLEQRTKIYEKSTHILSNFSLSRFLSTNLYTSRGINYNNSFCSTEIVSREGHYTQHNLYKNWATQNLAYTNVDIYCSWQTVSTNGVRTNSFAEVVGWGTFIAIVVTIVVTPPTVTATTIVTNFCFQVSNISLLLCFNY